VRIRAFGTYTLKAADPRVLLQELVGTDSVFEADEISELLRSIISTAFADVVAKSEIGLLDLASNYEDLSEAVRRVVMERIDDEYGLEIPQLYIVNISVPAEVEQALDTRSSMSVIGDMAAFQSYQLGQAMPAAAENPAGGLAGAGVGLGMGMAMAGPMMQGAGAPPPGQTPPPPPAPAAWHLAENGQTSGPYTLAQIAEGIAAGRIRPETMVWTGTHPPGDYGVDGGDGGLGGRGADAADRRPVPAGAAPTAERARLAERRGIKRIAVRGMAAPARRAPGSEPVLTTGSRRAAGNAARTRAANAATRTRLRFKVPRIANRKPASPAAPI
jgi:hypothetical protein